MNDVTVSAGAQLSLFETASQFARASHADACATCPVRYAAICEGVDETLVRQLGAISQNRHFGDGEAILREGEPRRHCFNVVSGMVRLYKLTAEGGMQVTGFLVPGDFIGLPMPGRVICSADAIGPTTLCRVPLDELQALLEDRPELYASLISVIGREFLETQEHMLWLGRMSAQARLASFLLDFSQRNARLGGRADRFLLPMRRGDIANHLGLAIETVSRVFTRFKQQGLIELPLPERVRLIDRDALASLAEDA